MTTLKQLRIPVRQYDSKIHSRPCYHDQHVSLVRFCGGDNYKLEYFYHDRVDDIPGSEVITCSTRE